MCSVQVVDGQGTKIGEEVTTELEVAPVKENVELLIEKDQEVHIEYQLSQTLCIGNGRRFYR